MKKAVAIIGAGNLGSRHLQGLQTIPTDTQIHVIDPLEPSLETSKSRWAETQAPHAVFFHNRLPESLPIIDCAIIACSANVRAEVTYNLLNTVKVKNIIFEKVLFQRLEDYDGMLHRIRTDNIKAWVNCPRRLWPVYKLFHEKINGTAVVHLQISGTQWGMGCNSIHMLDLTAFLSEDIEYDITHENLDKHTIPSKRTGFLEFTGNFGGKFSNGSTFFIESNAALHMPYTLMAKSEKASIIVHEDLDFYDLYENGKWTREKLDVLYQSQLSGDIVKTILQTGTCDLTPFADSVALHKPFLTMLLSHLKNLGQDTKSCPIT